MSAIEGEKLEKETKVKDTYYYYFEDGTKQISREVFKIIDKVIHYPRGFEGGRKYKTIDKFVYLGFKGKPPTGCIKSVSFGWGFSKILNPFAYFLDDNVALSEVVVEKKGKTQLDTNNQILYLSEQSLTVLCNSFSSVFKKSKLETKLVLDNELHKLFPQVFAKPNRTYTPNTLAISLSSWGNSIEEFSKNDKKAIRDLFEKLSIGNDFLSDQSLIKTKEIIDNKYIQETLLEYKELMNLTTDGDSLEKKWQLFLKNHSWIFSTIFAQPVILYQDEVYVGGKTINNQNGKLNDFLIQNSLSNNVSFLEIKTHKTKLLENSPYRGEDVYSTSKEVTGCLVQVLNQRDNFQKEFYALKNKSRANFETFNSKCIVLVGSINDLNENQKYSFELFRSNSRDVEILTFDELERKIESLQKLMLR